MAYNVCVRFTKTDDKEWFWVDPRYKTLTEDVTRIVGVDHVLPGLFGTVPVSPHEAVWKIQTQDENHSQQVLMNLVAWQSQFDSLRVKELADIISQEYTDWKESITVDLI